MNFERRRIANPAERIKGNKSNWEITNMTQNDVMSKLTDLNFLKNVPNGQVFTTPDGGYVTRYYSSYYKGGEVPTIMYNSSSGKIIHLRFMPKGP